MKRVMPGLGALVVLAAIAGCGSDPSTGGGGERRPAEPSLDADTPGAALATQGKKPPGPQATVVQALPPGNRSAAKEEAANDGEKLPARVLEENRRLRRELDHLEALEVEQRRVSLALGGGAGDFYDAPLRLGAGGLAWPVPGSVVSPFGQRWGRLHAGVDIAAPAGTVIRAAQDGGVALAGPTGGYGNYVCLQHTTQLSTCYAHLSRFLTRKGAVVRQGEPIGLVGCTGHCFGDHLHFETRVGGQPVDPLGYL